MEGLYSFLFTSSVFIIAVVLLRALLKNNQYESAVRVMGFCSRKAADCAGASD